MGQKRKMEQMEQNHQIKICDLKGTKKALPILYGRAWKGKFEGVMEVCFFNKQQKSYFF